MCAAHFKGRHFLGGRFGSGSSADEEAEFGVSWLSELMLENNENTQVMQDTGIIYMNL